MVFMQWAIYSFSPGIWACVFLVLFKLEVELTCVFVDGDSALSCHCPPLAPKRRLRWCFVSVPVSLYKRSPMSTTAECLPCILFLQLVAREAAAKAGLSKKSKNTAFSVLKRGRSFTWSYRGLAVWHVSKNLSMEVRRLSCLVSIVGHSPHL